MSSKENKKPNEEIRIPSRSRFRAAWDYLWLSLVNALVFGGAGYMYAYQYRPLSEQGPTIVSLFLAVGVAWGVWSAYRKQRGKEPL